MASENFKGIWIPQETLDNTELDSLNIVVLDSIIENLSKKEPCYASDAYLASIVKVTKRTVQRYLARLKQLGRIRVEHLQQDNSSRIIHYLGRHYQSPSEIYSQGCANNSEPPETNAQPARQKDTSLVTNCQTYNKHDNKADKKVDNCSSPPSEISLRPEKSWAQQFIERWNETASQTDALLELEIREDSNSYRNAVEKLTQLEQDSFFREREENFWRAIPQTDAWFRQWKPTLAQLCFGADKTGELHRDKLIAGAYAQWDSQEEESRQRDFFARQDAEAEQIKSLMIERRNRERTEPVLIGTILAANLKRYRDQEGG